MWIAPRMPRTAFTLIELLVVIGIIAVLVGLVLPAIQQVRGSASRADCSNQLKQIGLAAHQFHDAQQQFPTGMPSWTSRAPYPYSSWRTRLLPYLEQQSLWAVTELAFQQSRLPFNNTPHVGLATPLRTFACPADNRVRVLQFAPRSKKFVALSSYLGVSGKTSWTRDGVLFRDSKIRFADITDGTSQTLFVGERPPSTDFQFGWWYAGIGQLAWGSADSVLGVEEPNRQPVTNGSCAPGTYTFGPGRFDNQCDMFHFWSPHVGNGANFLYADGSVHFLAYSAAPLLPALASRSGGEATQAP